MIPESFDWTCFFKLQMVYLLLSSLTELLTIFGEDSFNNVERLGEDMLTGGSMLLMLTFMAGVYIGLIQCDL